VATKTKKGGRSAQWYFWRRETHHAFVGLVLAAGAVGYILLRAALGELFGAIRAASRGRRYVDPELDEALFQLLARQADSGTKVLSRREQEVLRTLAYGYTLKEIASSLNISRKSIETDRARSREKLGVRTRRISSDMHSRQGHSTMKSSRHP
jgi:DNA-binding NarL/FixJ family response regulator